MTGATFASAATVSGLTFRSADADPDRRRRDLETAWDQGWVGYAFGDQTNDNPYRRNA